MTEHTRSLTSSWARAKQGTHGHTLRADYLEWYAHSVRPSRWCGGGSGAWEEDKWAQLKVSVQGGSGGQVELLAVKPCDRWMVVCISVHGCCTGRSCHYNHMLLITTAQLPAPCPLAPVPSLLHSVVHHRSDGTVTISVCAACVWRAQVQGAHRGPGHGGEERRRAVRRAHHLQARGHASFNH